MLHATQVLHAFRVTCNILVSGSVFRDAGIPGQLLSPMVAANRDTPTR